MKIIHDIRLPLGSSEKQVIRAALTKAALPLDTEAFIYRKSIDARRSDITEVYSVAVKTDLENAKLSELNEYLPAFEKHSDKSVFVIGFGPAGLFCSYALALAGLHPIAAERGKTIAERADDVEKFLTSGMLNTESNVRFGEGGAGTFSDGKLTTRINDPRSRFVLETFVKFGAPEEILYLAKPHIGTDLLRRIIKNMREEIISLGGKILYNTKLTDIVFQNNKVSAIRLNDELYDAENVVLAIGNGANDTYEMLLSKPLQIAAKPFSVGFRMEHLQSDINRAIYGKYAEDRRLRAADYSFFKHIDRAASKTVYTFCMCPGGEVINSSSEVGQLVTNGMSYHARAGKNANSALLASVSFDTPRQGLDFRKDIEKKAFEMFSGDAPVVLADDFLKGKISSGFGRIKPTFRPGTAFADFDKIFPPQVSSMLREGVASFGRSVCSSPDAVLTAPETGSSSPVRIVRTENMNAVGIKGLYPCGEGAGYAGGIVSSAVDGIRIAEQILKD